MIAGKNFNVNDSVMNIYYYILYINFFKFLFQVDRFILPSGNRGRSSGRSMKMGAISP